MNQETAAARHNVVVKANELIQKSRFSLTMQQQKIVLYLISQIQPKDEELKQYEFSIPAFCRTCGIDETSGKNYKALKQAMKDIRDKSLWVTLPDGRETLLAWIEKAYINPNCGTIQIKLDEDMKPFLLRLKSNFTQYELCWTLKFKCKYSIRLYELIKSLHYSDLESYTQEIPLDKLRQLMGAEKYTVFCDFHARALRPAVQEINQYSDKTLGYELIKKGKAVTGVRLEIGTKDARDRLLLADQIGKDLDHQKGADLRGS